MMQLLGNKTVSILAMYKTYQKDVQPSCLTYAAIYAISRVLPFHGISWH